jgi:hypothetical protein
MRALWFAAPLALTRYVAVFAAIALAAALAAGAAASNPFVRAGVKSASLRGEVRSASPYSAGLSVVSWGGLASGDVARRAAAVRFGHRLAFAGPPVLTSDFTAEIQSPTGTSLAVKVMARTNATAHVTALSGSGPGAWVSAAISQGEPVRAGTTLTLTEFTPGGKPRTARIRIGHVYRSLETNLEDPYWANRIQDIRSLNPDGSLPPSYVLVDEPTLLRLARQLDQGAENQFEFPVATKDLTYVGATKLQKTYASLTRALEKPRSTVGAGMGCGRVSNYDGKPSCVVSSSLSAMLLIASNDVSALSATIWLLSVCALGIALLVAAAAGVFLVRRRADEAQLLFARGEHAVSFATRTAIEALFPAALGVAIGLGTAFLALRVAAPAGSLDRGTELLGIRDATLAGVVAVLLLAIVAGASFPRRSDTGHPLWRRVARVPWEVLPLAGAGAVLGILLTGGGLSHTASGDAHPSLAVFLFPVLAAAGIAGLVSRGVRRAARSLGSRAALPVFFTVRRIAAARGLLIAVIVAAATSLAVFAYATTLSSSVSRAIAEKAYVGNGSNVQGVVDPSEKIYDPLPFPATIVEADSSDAFVSDGHPVDIVAGDPGEIGRVILWGPWSDDPRKVLPRLEHATAPPGVLPVIASPSLPHIDAIFDQGRRIPITVVARAPFPGMTQGRPAILLSRDVLRRVAARAHILDPGPGAGGLIWARGNPRQIEGPLLASNIDPAFLTTFNLIRGDPSVRAGKRSYGYLRAIGGGAVVLALLALLLYLQARQRGQIVASALLRRMGMRARTDTAAIGLEAASIVVLAFAVGLVVAALAAHLVTPHVDPLPQYPPGTHLIVPWLDLLAVGLGSVVIAVLLAAGAVLLANRSDASEALRVA